MVERINHPNVIGGVSFFERASYNGRKIIIPNTVHSLTRWVSREYQGRLVLDTSELKDMQFLYRHESKSGMLTTLWVPGKGVKGVARKVDDTLRLEFNGSVSNKKKEELIEDRYLLLGGYEDQESLDKIFEGRYSYYVMVRRAMPQ